MFYTLTMSALGTANKCWAGRLHMAGLALDHVNSQRHILEGFTRDVMWVHRLEGSVLSTGRIKTVAGYITLWISAADAKAAKTQLISQDTLQCIAAVAFPGVTFTTAWDAVMLEGQEALKIAHTGARAPTVAVNHDSVLLIA